MHVVTTAPTIIPLGHAGELRSVASFHFKVTTLSGKPHLNLWSSDETFFLSMCSYYSNSHCFVLPQVKVGMKLVFAPLLKSRRTCYLLVLGNTTGGGIMVIIPGLQTGRNSDDQVECQMSDLVRRGPTKFPEGPLVRRMH